MTCVGFCMNLQVDFSFDLLQTKKTNDLVSGLKYWQHTDKCSFAYLEEAYSSLLHGHVLVILFSSIKTEIPDGCCETSKLINLF